MEIENERDSVYSENNGTLKIVIIPGEKMKTIQKMVILLVMKIKTVLRIATVLMMKARRSIMMMNKKKED